MFRAVSVLVAVACGVAADEAPVSLIYGSGSEGALVKIDSLTGKIIPESPQRPKELQGE